MFPNNAKRYLAAAAAAPVLSASHYLAQCNRKSPETPDMHCRRFIFGFCRFPCNSIFSVLRFHPVACAPPGIGKQAETLIEKYLSRRDVTLPPGFVGVDPLNRDEEGAQTDHVHGLTTDICEWGWVDRKSVGGICIEEADGSTAIKDFNAALAKGDPLMPQDSSMVKMGSISKTHLNLTLRCWRENMACGCDHLPGTKGMDLTNLEKVLG